MRMVEAEMMFAVDEAKMKVPADERLCPVCDARPVTVRCACCPAAVEVRGDESRTTRGKKSGQSDHVGVRRGRPSTFLTVAHIHVCEEEELRGRGADDDAEGHARRHVHNA